MDEDYVPRMYRENETTENVQEGPPTYDLLAGLHEDRLAMDDGPIATRGGIQFQRPTRQQWLDRADVRLQDILDSASKVRVRLYIGELSAEIGEFDTRQGSADLAALLRQVAGRLDP